MVSQASEPESDTPSLIGQYVPARRAKAETQECETYDPDTTLESTSAEMGPTALAPRLLQSVQLVNASPLLHRCV